METHEKSREQLVLFVCSYPDEVLSVLSLELFSS